MHRADTSQNRIQRDSRAITTRGQSAGSQSTSSQSTSASPFASLLAESTSRISTPAVSTTKPAATVYARGQSSAPITPRAVKSSDSSLTPVGDPAPEFNLMQQSWLDANSGPYANLLKSSLSRTTPYTLNTVTASWSNLSTGRPELFTRAVGVVSQTDAQELATQLGGTVVESPFTALGGAAKDLYIRMPNGQMVDASVLANDLNNARGGKDPFSATQAVLNAYSTEAQSFNYDSANDAIYRVMRGVFSTTPRALPS